MADSMCGPSNALNTFQKHTQADRALQQDRLVSRQSPSQGFRSTPGPNAAFLDPEFEAFQAGHPPLESQVPNSFAYTHTPSPFQAAPPTFQQQAGSAAWAADFQNMHLSSPGGQQLRQRNAGTPQAQAGWHQEFAQQAGNATGVANYQQPVHGQGMQNGYANMRLGHNMVGGQFIGGFVGQQGGASVAQQLQEPELFDEEAFARAFEEAEQAELLQSSPSQIETEITTSVAAEQTAQTEQEQITRPDDAVLLASPPEHLLQSSQLNQNPLGADYILPQSQTSRNKHNHDDLARTAGQLLTNLRGDTSEKFQQSKFLDLMRMFRDKEVVIEGERIVDKGYADLEGDAERAVGVVKGAEEVGGVQAQ